MKLIEKDTPGQRIADLCKDYGISQKELAGKIGLSENAIKGLVTETIDFEDTVALGMMSRNDMINMATMSLSEIMQHNPAQKAEAKYDIRLLNAQKFGKNEAEIERMKNIFMSILREIKGDIDTQQMPSPDINAEMFQSILDSATENPPVTLDDVLSLVTSKMSMVMEVDDNAKEQFNALFTQMAEQFKEQN